MKYRTVGSKAMIAAGLAALTGSLVGTINSGIHAFNHSRDVAIHREAEILETMLENVAYNSLDTYNWNSEADREQARELVRRNNPNIIELEERIERLKADPDYERQVAAEQAYDEHKAVHRLPIYAALIGTGLLAGGVMRKEELVIEGDVNE